MASGRWPRGRFNKPILKRSSRKATSYPNLAISLVSRNFALHKLYAFSALDLYNFFFLLSRLSMMFVPYSLFFFYDLPRGRLHGMVEMYDNTFIFVIAFELLYY